MSLGGDHTAEQNATAARYSGGSHGLCVQYSTPRKVGAGAMSYQDLAAPMPNEAKQHTDKKGYDATGYGYQYVANRLNEVLGIDGWRTEHEVIALDEVPTGREGRVRYHCTILLRLQIGSYDDSGQWFTKAQRECYGGQEANLRADALKGAWTNAFKKTAALVGPGRAAYEGSIDEDMQGDRGHAQPPPQRGRQQDSGQSRGRQQPNEQQSSTQDQAPAQKVAVRKRVGDLIAQRFGDDTKPIGRYIREQFGKPIKDMDDKELLKLESYLLVPEGTFDQLASDQTRDRVKELLEQTFGEDKDATSATLTAVTGRKAPWSKRTEKELLKVEHQILVGNDDEEDFPA